MSLTEAAVATVMRELRATLCDAERPPLGGKYPAVEHRGGLEVPLDLQPGERDCTGQLWVHVIRRYRSSDFPGEDAAPLCTVSPAIVLQAGAARCVEVMQDNLVPPSAAVEEQQALVLMDDADRMDLALCRAGAALEDSGLAHRYALGAWMPQGPEGGILVGLQTMTIQLRSW